MQTLEHPVSQQAQARPVEWAIAVFGYNEAASLPRCLEAVVRAGQGRTVDVTVVLNGSTDQSPDVAMAAMRRLGLRGRIALIPQADKSNAFNQYVHRLRVPAPFHVFVDAYAAITPDSLTWLARALHDAPEANGAAAVPSTGRSAAVLRQQMQKEPGLHGSLFMLRGSFLERMAAQNLRLPLNFYRGDGLIASLVLHDLDAHSGDWKPHRVVVEPRATWEGPVLRPWQWNDLRRYWRRQLQQARGRLQWPALRQVIYDPARPPGASGFAAMPAEADALVLSWIAESPAERTPRWSRDLFGALALRRMRRAPPPPPEERLLPRVLMEFTP
jgi:glycosyltransferase involved in cell wall biosynthesis